MGRGKRRAPARARDWERSDEESFDRFVASYRRTEFRRGREWTVQPIGGARSEKEYTCPGCGRTITAGTSHLAAWRADGIMGDAADLAARRHWHTHCWRIS